jgi:glycosyltransferase involved in cell wall biosynthesis
MKILYYSPHPYLNLSDQTGYGTHMREMIEAFKKQGHEVMAVINGGTKKPADNGKEVKKQSITIRMLKKLTPGIIWRSIKDYRLILYDLKAESNLESIVKEYNPDLIYERVYYMQVSGVNIAKKYGIKHYLEINAPYIEENREFEGSASLFSNKALKHEKQQLMFTDKPIVVSSPLKNYFTKKIKDIKTSKILIIPNSVNPDKIRVDIKIKNEVVSKYHLQDHLVIGFVGSIFPYHGVDLLIKAFDLVFNKNKKIKLLIVGDGMTKSEMNNYRKKLESGSNIIFTGKVDHDKVFSYMDVMDITVLANTKWYCSPIKIFEYGFLNKAIIAPDMDCIRDVMVNNEDGLLIQPDKELFAKAMIKLIEDSDLRSRLGNSFKNKILSCHTWTKNAEQVLNN